MSPTAQSITPPSTDWQEQIADDEDERFERYAETLRDIQRRQSRKKGAAGRALHRKAHAGVEAELEVLPELPAELRAGLFAQPGRYRGYARFSNGRHVHGPDPAPDLRGLAIKVVGVEGRKLIPGLEDAKTQDFLAISTPATPFRSTDGFIRFATAVENQALAFPRLISAFGARGTATLAREMRSLMGPASIATIPFYSAVPVRWGDYAAKYAFFPGAAEARSARPRVGSAYLADELAGRLAEGPLHFDMKVQLYRDEERTPIENASVEWREDVAPFIAVGRLTIPQQDLASERGRKLAAFVDAIAFDPWHALEAHRPLGDIMRARNAAYRLSTIERKAAPEPDGSEPFD
jgi:hypothetical protein